VIFYGSTTLMRNVAREGRWTPGVFFDEARFAFEALRAGYGEALLNGASEVVTAGEFAARDLDPEAEYFVRPANDLKEFRRAMVRTFAEVASWREGLGRATGPLGLDTKIQVAPPLALGREWRTVVVDGDGGGREPVPDHGRLKVTGEVPAEVTAFAGEMAARYAPAPVFVLDVGEVETGCAWWRPTASTARASTGATSTTIVRRVTGFVRRM
jgi:hypothetical protein